MPSEIHKSGFAAKCLCYKLRKKASFSELSPFRYNKRWIVDVKMLFCRENSEM